MPSDRENRQRRQEELRQILFSGEQVASQEQMVELLRERGIAATQSSVSRDMRDLGIYRYGKYYALPASRDVDEMAARHDLGLRTTLFLKEVRSAGAHLLVLLTQLGGARALGVAIEGMKWAEVLGIVAGDDTLFIATPGIMEQRRVAERLKKLFPEKK